MVKPWLPGPTFQNFFDLSYYSFKFILTLISLALTIWSSMIPS